MTYEKADPVTVSLEALKAGELALSTIIYTEIDTDMLLIGTVDFESLEKAFGPDSLGIIVVSGLSPKFIALRRRLLSYASHLGNLSQSELEALECPEAKYLVGWSCGKEKLANDKVDTLKGSYYVNCAFYKDPKLDGADGDYPDLPEYTKGNIWPREGLLDGFRETFQELVSVWQWARMKLVQ
jgi:hypothetical protein